MWYGIVNSEIRMCGEVLVVSFIEIREENNRLLVMGNGLDMGVGLDIGNWIVVNLLKRYFIEVEVLFLLKGLKFCLILERIDIYNVRKDIRDYIWWIRLREYFYCEDRVDGDFFEMLVFRMKFVWCLERNREMVIEVYVEVFERRILLYDLNVKCYCNLI